MYRVEALDVDSQAPSASYSDHRHAGRLGFAEGEVAGRLGRELGLSLGAVAEGKQARSRAEIVGQDSASKQASGHEAAPIHLVPEAARLGQLAGAQFVAQRVRWRQRPIAGPDPDVRLPAPAVAAWRLPHLLVWIAAKICV